MNNIYIKARSDGKVYSGDAGNLEIAVGDLVIFESDQCQEIAKVISKEEASFVDPGKGENLTVAIIIRRLNERDITLGQERKEAAAANLEKCRQIVKKHDLPMEILDADLSFDDRKLTFYFSAPGRVDFRALVSELASNFQKLIRLQQVGSRDRARLMGGVGRCGRGFCCKKFLKGDLDCVTLDMAQDQNLAQMGANRVTGACGKLMCCLKYELGFYKEVKEKLPTVGTEFSAKRGKGLVVGQNVLNNSIKVQFSDKTVVEVPC